MTEYVKESSGLGDNKPKVVAELPPEQIKPRMVAALKRAFMMPAKHQKVAKLNQTQKS